MALVCCGVLVGFGSALGMRKWGAQGLAATAVLIAVFLLAIGYLDYRAQSVKDTPLRAYVLGSLCSTFLAALAVASCSRFGLKMVVQGALGSFVWLASTWLIALSTVFL